MLIGVKPGLYTWYFGKERCLLFSCWGVIGCIDKILYKSTSPKCLSNVVNMLALYLLELIKCAVSFPREQQRFEALLGLGNDILQGLTPCWQFILGFVDMILMFMVGHFLEKDEGNYSESWGSWKAIYLLLLLFGVVHIKRFCRLEIFSKVILDVVTLLVALYVLIILNCILLL